MCDWQTCVSMYYEALARLLKDCDFGINARVYGPTVCEACSDFVAAESTSTNACVQLSIPVYKEAT